MAPPSPQDFEDVHGALALHLEASPVLGRLEGNEAFFGGSYIESYKVTPKGTTLGPLGKLTCE